MTRSGLVSVRRALWRLAATSVLAVVLVAAAATVLAGRIARDEAVDDAAHHASRLAQVLGPPNVYADPDHPSHERGLRRLDRLVGERLAEGVILRVKVWDRDGTVVYSDERRLMGRRFELEPQDLALFGTEDAYADLTDLAAEENVFDREAGRRVDAVVEVYAGFESADGQPLLFEAYFPAQDLLHHERELVAKLVPAMAAGPLIAMLALSPMVLRLVRTLRAADDQRMRWVQDMFRARIEERRSAARQIHDHVLPGLTGVSLTLDLGAQELDRDGSSRAPVLRQASGAVRAEILNLRRMLSDLRSPAVERVGLADALDELSGPLVEAGVSVVIDPLPADLTEDETQLVYGLAGEGLRNAHRHAGAREVRVCVQRREDELTVEVRDDGRGIAEPEPLRSDHGLGLLADPLAELGGELVLRAGEQHGAVLFMRLPTQRRPGAATTASRW